ncbi:aBC transporter substrate binding protein [Ruminococcus sp. CAG:382]|jgi:hypothetical protein|nr:aBC transporter substrate binding protein [Ruminococcus sp. CAG:382]
MKKTKIISLMLAALLMFCMLAACNDSTSDSNVKKIGVMQFAEFDALQKAYDGFVDGLKEAGYEDGKNIEITKLSAAADTANCPTIADTLINNGSDLIYAIATPSVSAIKEKTTTIPVLFTAVTDPVKSGFVADVNNPGGNISGTSDMNPVKEQIDLLKAILPDAKTVAVLYCSSESNSAAQYALAKAQIEALGMTCIEKTISAIDEAKSAVESLAGVADAIYVPTDNTISDSMTSVSAAANAVKLPLIVGEAGMVVNGALATYGIDYYRLGKQTAEMAVKLLKADKPLDEIAKMAVVYQTDCVYAVNTDTAAALGITIPEEILSKATIYPSK